MPDEMPMLGSGDHPLAVGRHFQTAAAPRLRFPDGKLTKPGKLYLIGIFPGSDPPVVCGGPYRTDAEVDKAMREIVLQSAALPCTTVGGGHG